MNLPFSLVPKLHLGTHLLRQFHCRSQRKTTLLSFHYLVKKSNCIAVELSIGMVLSIKGLSWSICVKNQTQLHGYGLVSAAEDKSGQPGGRARTVLQRVKKKLGLDLLSV